MNSFVLSYSKYSLKTFCWPEVSDTGQSIAFRAEIWVSLTVLPLISWEELGDSLNFFELQVFGSVRD